MEYGRKRFGFTFVEVMIVTTVIAIFLSVAVPNFLKSRRQSQATTCVGNLKQIEAAVEQCRYSGRVVIGESDIYGPSAYLKQKPRCPSGGDYTLPVGDTDDPVCSFTGTDAADKSTWHQIICTTD